MSRIVEFHLSTGIEAAQAACETIDQQSTIEQQLLAAQFN
jgi:hypothetical protein